MFSSLMFQRGARRALIGLPLVLTLLRQASGETMTINTPTGLLYGTLETASATGPSPVALIIAGSGPVDRDGNSPTAGLNTDCYKLLAQALARQGIASLRYDKRGIGQSAPAAVDERLLRFHIFVDDAIAWARALRRDPRFSTVTIIGHSEGALIGIVGASEAPVDGVISIAGAGEPLSELLLKQLDRRLPPDAYAAAQAIVAKLKQGTLTDHVPPLLEPVLRASVQPYLVSLFRVDPVAEVAKLKVPVLIVQGGRDPQVGVSDAVALAKTSPSARLVLLPEMNHVLKDAKESSGDGSAAYRDPTLEIDPELVHAVGDFIDHLKH